MFGKQKIVIILIIIKSPENKWAEETYSHT